jgi:glycosyltransferase involved in cell wall biosynthesis
VTVATSASRGSRRSARRVLLLNWRDTGHPYGGGSEVYVERVADGLARLGHDVTLFTARYPGSAVTEQRPSGVRIVRAGGRLGVYLRAAVRYRRARRGPDVVVEVQNGMPFLSRLWVRRRTPVVVLVHHVHREQWPIVFGPVRARIGWWLESRVAPRVNRHVPYVAVSDSTRAQLAELGVDAARIELIHNGTAEPETGEVGQSDEPLLLVLGRLVPHKRVEIALETVAALRAELPAVRLVIAGQGWWDAKLRERAAELGVADIADFVGHVSDAERHRLYARSWVSLVPSVKEGWGLVVVEAGAHGVPSVAFESAGGITESIVAGETGLLARPDDVEDFVAQTRTLLLDHGLRARMGVQAAIHAKKYSWDAAVRGYDELIERVSASRS